MYYSVDILICEYKRISDKHCKDLGAAAADDAAADDADDDADDDDVDD